MASASSAKLKAKGKRKRVVLSIKEKVEILKLLDNKISYTLIAEKYGIGRSTVSDIKKNKKKILEYRGELVERGVKKTVKAIKYGEDQRLDQAVYMWFKQKQMEGVPVSGGMLREKALELNRKLHGENSFKASEGGSGSSAIDMEYDSYLCRERSSQVTKKQLIVSKRDSES